MFHSKICAVASGDRMEIIMCTAVYYDRGCHIFGRTLDLECSYGESLVTVPQGYVLEFLHMPAVGEHFSFIGTAHLAGGAPLFYDGINEHGVAAAALNFPGFAKYRGREDGRVNLASFEFLSYTLALADSVKSARELLSQLNITDDVAGEGLPSTPLHYIISARDGTIVIEQTECGLHIYDNPYGTLTNAPELPYHLFRLADFYGLDSARGEDRLTPELPLSVFSRGMGSIGLPGDFSSPSRFVRAVYAKNKTSPTDAGDGLAESAFFHIMGTVSIPNGCVVTDDGKNVRTVYTSAMNLDTLTYAVRGYDSEKVTRVALSEASGNELSVVPFDV